jgi:hypothetical protein
LRHGINVAGISPNETISDFIQQSWFAVMRFQHQFSKQRIGPCKPFAAEFCSVIFMK